MDGSAMGTVWAVEVGDGRQVSGPRKRGKNAARDGEVDRIWLGMQRAGGYGSRLVFMYGVQRGPELHGQGSLGSAFPGR